MLFKMDQKPFAILVIAVLAMTSNACAIYWSSSVDTNSSHWSIYRQSSNISFDFSSTVEGKISPVEHHDRILSPYQSYYGEVGNNDVRLRQRTSALEGSYRSADEIKFRSVVYPDDIEISIDKPTGTDVYTIEYKNEIWPVFIENNRLLEYKGRQINDRDFEGNNGDFVGANFLYNREFSKKQRSILWLLRMNATVKATDDAILLAEFKPTKYLGYLVQTESSGGIADLGYKQKDFNYDPKHRNYPIVNMGVERYYGAFDLIRKIEMRSVFENYDVDDEWLPCRKCNWNASTVLSGEHLYGTNERDLFNCTSSFARKGP
jgi:hypothetical protein